MSERPVIFLCPSCAAKLEYVYILREIPGTEGWGSCNTGYIMGEEKVYGKQYEFEARAEQESRTRYYSYAARASRRRSGGGERARATKEAKGR